MASTPLRRRTSTRTRPFTTGGRDAAAAIQPAHHPHAHLWHVIRWPDIERRPLRPVGNMLAWRRQRWQPD
jgi:hypothetical protein